MKTLQDIISEKLILNRSTNPVKQPLHPQNWRELRDLLEKLLKERGKDADLNDIDISKVTDLSWLFDNLDPHEIDISEWDVSNVWNMNGMFYDCENFNCDLSSWDVSKVETMEYTFHYCKEFEGEGLDNWNVDDVMSMRHMFDGCKCKKPEWY